MEAVKRPVKISGAATGRTTRMLAIGALTIAVLGIAAWLVVDRVGTGSSTATTVTASSGPEAVTTARLSALAKQVGHPIYWAGAIAGQTMEFTQATDGRDYVRYLPKGVEIGDPRADFRVVATYPFPGAYDALKKVAKGNEIAIPGGGIAVVSDGNSKSVHIAFPNVDYQVEVYDPSSETALAVSTSGDIRPVP